MNRRTSVTTPRTAEAKRVRQQAGPERVGELVTADPPAVLGGEVREYEFGAAFGESARRASVVLAIDRKSAEEPKSLSLTRIKHPIARPPARASGANCASFAIRLRPPW